ncbi:MAG: asparagine synthase (glutamine-hydrolyzing) [Vicinamibacterales bacterium]
MCGIAGIVDFDGRDVPEALVRSMCDAICHRGPDDEGIGSWPKVASTGEPRAVLGNRRLSIIDVAGGHQPISNEDGSIWTVQNGEIYNFQVLRDRLEARGHRFATHSDTEIIVHLYEDLGEAFASELDGMFAIALWDDRQKKLILARDRFGKKPVLYAEAGGRLWFGSEFQALLADPAIDRAIDYDALDEYLAFMSIPAPLTIYKQIRKLPPAHVLVRDASGTRLSRYWHLDYTPKLAMDEQEATGELRRLLTEAVRKRLISEVPLGAFLSGGVDSSAVVALMAGLQGSPVKTFSIGFDDPRFNELPHARRIAERYGCEHHEFEVHPRAVEVLPTLVSHYGEPYADSSAIPSFYLAKLTRQHVTVALNGDGGDEAFAGYGWHLGARLAEQWLRVPKPLRAIGETVASRMAPLSSNRRSSLSRAARFIAGADRPRAERYRSWLSVFTPELKAELYGGRSRASGEDRLAPIFAATAQLDPVDAMLAADVAWYMPTDLLVKMDIATMANSLESRSPFLDRDLAEFAARLPSHYKLRGRTSKYLLKKAIADLVPDDNVHRRKQGFAVPIGAWFRGELREFLADHILSRRFAERGLFSQPVVERLFNDHQRGAGDYAHHLWVLLMLELWFRAFIDAPVHAAPVEAAGSLRP